MKLELEKLNCNKNKKLKLNLTSKELQEIANSYANSTKRKKRIDLMIYKGSYGPYL